MGFLFDMLEKAEGSICQATNLLKTLSNHPQSMNAVSPHIFMLISSIAGPLGLLEEEQPGTPLTLMLQNLNRFLCDAMAQNYRSVPPHATTMEQVSTFQIRNGYADKLQRCLLRQLPLPSNA